MQTIQDVHVESTSSLVTPAQLKLELPLTQRAAATVLHGRAQIKACLEGRDDRLLAIVGPCSIHDPVAALEYAAQLRELAERHHSQLVVCMRVYFEKPRTNVGWKGLINDPHLDGSCDVAHGIRLARHLLVTLSELGLPCATETLDPVMPQYLADLISWTAIGARTTESQTHRELASGLSMPVGFKNGTDGGLTIAIHAMKAARAPHSFLGIDAGGQVSVVRTRGNPHAHVVLRGGHHGPNFEQCHVRAAADELTRVGLNPRVMVDCSHGNSQKNHENQACVARVVATQIAGGDSPIIGVMIESHLQPGRQDLTPGRPIAYGQSITDACIDMTTTAQVLAELAEAVDARRAHGSDSRT